MNEMIYFEHIFFQILHRVTKYFDCALHTFVFHFLTRGDFIYRAATLPSKTFHHSLGKIW